MDVFDNWRELNSASLFLRVVLALIIGGSIGLERGSKNQPAGFRTYMLVCLGAALVMMTNQHISERFGVGDPSRLGAQVISGIGFLGAGTIIVTRNSRVRGLTTAAGLWSAACIGLALGIGFYEGAVVVGAAILLIMTVFQKLDHKMQERSRFMRLYLNFVSSDALNEFMETCKSMEIKLIDMQVSKVKGNSKNELTAVITLKTLQARPHSEIVQKISSLNGLKYLEEI
ncbi:MAG: MgtC/SapB family protein [Clostridiaceae bacterium]|nr:MgtC/SapB family protein [Clostridiaceae bacterium]